jgi:rhodanese-related sulfurtransferase
LPGAINIPLEELRQRLGELAPDRSITVFCQVGLRGYVATRLLMQHGFQNVRNLKGGYRLAMLSAPRMTSTG